MTKDEFILICTKCGYASKRVARFYARDKSELSDDDFIEVFRIFERLMASKNHEVDERFAAFEYGRTTRIISDDPN